MSAAAEPSSLTLPATIARRLLAHTRRELPNEACALLAGDGVAGRVTTLYPAGNRHASPYRYDVDPGDLVRILHDIERRGDDLVAIFHSHPVGPPIPSAADIREARYEALHVLADASRDDGGLRAWRIESQKAYEVPLAIR